MGDRRMSEELSKGFTGIEVNGVKFSNIREMLIYMNKQRDRIVELEQLIEKMKRHCNCKHRDSEGYCEVKRTYLIDLSYDGCNKWELED
jgi:hypothetical protein